MRIGIAVVAALILAPLATSAQRSFSPEQFVIRVGSRLELAGKPFRFGGATVRKALQAFVRVRIVFPNGASATGAAAEMMMPKWFDKSPGRSDADDLADLRRSLAAAAEAYTGDAQRR